jgi:hypothetical protein
VRRCMHQPIGESGFGDTKLNAAHDPIPHDPHPTYSGLARHASSALTGLTITGPLASEGYNSNLPQSGVVQRPAELHRADLDKI